VTPPSGLTMAVRTAEPGSLEVSTAARWIADIERCTWCLHPSPGAPVRQGGGTPWLPPRPDAFRQLRSYPRRGGDRVAGDRRSGRLAGPIAVGM